MINKSSVKVFFMKIPLGFQIVKVGCYKNHNLFVIMNQGQPFSSLTVPHITSTISIIRKYLKRRIDMTNKKFSRSDKFIIVALVEIALIVAGIVGKAATTQTGSHYDVTN